MITETIVPEEENRAREIQMEREMDEANDADEGDQDKKIINTTSNHQEIVITLADFFLSVKAGLQKWGDKAKDAIIDELMLFAKRRYLTK